MFIMTYNDQSIGKPFWLPSKVPWVISGARSIQLRLFSEWILLKKLSPCKPQPPHRTRKSNSQTLGLPITFMIRNGPSTQALKRPSGSLEEVYPCSQNPAAITWLHNYHPTFQLASLHIPQKQKLEYPTYSILLCHHHIGRLKTHARLSPDSLLRHQGCSNLIPELNLNKKLSFPAFIFTHKHSSFIPSLKVSFKTFFLEEFFLISPQWQMWSF